MGHKLTENLRWLASLQEKKNKEREEKKKKEKKLMNHRFVFYVIEK